MKDMRISRFDCRSPVCEYKETIPLEFSPLSIAIHEQQFTVMGHTPFLGEEEVIDNHAVRLLDWNGNTNNVFGYFYDTDEFIVRFIIMPSISLPGRVITWELTQTDRTGSFTSQRKG